MPTLVLTLLRLVLVLDSVVDTVDRFESVAVSEVLMFTRLLLIPT